MREAPSHPSEVFRQGGYVPREADRSRTGISGNEVRAWLSPAGADEDRWYRDAPSPYQAEGAVCFFGACEDAPRGR